jgi:hypothetical protein
MALRTQFGRQFVFVKDGDLAQHAQRPHCDVVLATRLQSSDDWEK